MWRAAGRKPAVLRALNRREDNPRGSPARLGDSPMPLPISDAAVGEYHDAGFYLARGFFDAAEIDLLRRSARADNELDKRSFGRAGGEGGVVRLSLWNNTGDGIY